MKNKKKLFAYESDKVKGIFTLGAVLFVILWLVLWHLFPMEWYAVFFNDVAGSIVHLVLLACALSVPMCFVFSIIAKNDIPFVKTLIANIICLVALDYIYSIFFASRFIFVVLVSLAHLAVNIFLFGTAKSKDGKSVIIPIKRQPLNTLVWAAVYTVIIDVSDIALMRVIAFIYYGR